MLGWPTALPDALLFALLPRNLMLSLALSTTYCGDCQILVPSPNSPDPQLDAQEASQTSPGQNKALHSMPPSCSSSLLFLTKWLLPPQLLRLKSESRPEGSFPAPHPPRPSLHPLGTHCSLSYSTSWSFLSERSPHPPMKYDLLRTHSFHGAEQGQACPAGTQGMPAEWMDGCTGSRQ